MTKYFVSLCLFLIAAWPQISSADIYQNMMCQKTKGSVSMLNGRQVCNGSCEWICPINSPTRYKYPSYFIDKVEVLGKSLSTRVCNATSCTAVQNCTSSQCASIADVTYTEQLIVQSEKLQPIINTYDQLLYMVVYTNNSGTFKQYKVKWHGDFLDNGLQPNAIHKTLTISPGETHYFAFWLHSNEHYAFIKTQANIDVDLHVSFNPFFNGLVFGGPKPLTSESYSGNETITWCDTGPVYIKVFGYNGTGKYTLDVVTTNKLPGKCGL